MKTIFRIAMLAFVTMAFSAVSAFAQDACTFEKKQELYQKFRTFKTAKTAAEIRAAVKAGEEFLEKCATPDDQAVVDYIKKNIPEQNEQADKMDLFARFDSAIKTANVDEAFSSGRGIIAKEPTLALDVSIVLALFGFDNSIKTPPVDKYNGEAINFAKKVISDIQAGGTSNNYGALTKSLLVKTGTAANAPVDQAKSKNNVIATMNYIIGSIMYYNQKAEKDALPYFYKATQIDSPVKTKADIYSAIGGWYLKEIVKMEADRQAKITANGNQDNEETLQLLAVMKGYAERGINALSKAHKISAADPKTPADFKKSLYEKLQGLYQVRFDKTEGLDAYIATASNQPLPDPTTPVAPIVETPATTTNPTSTSSSTSTSTSTTDVTTKPVNTVPTNTKSVTNPTVNPTTKPATTPVKPTASPTTKPAAKTTGGAKTKAVNKKKGTR